MLRDPTTHARPVPSLAHTPAKLTPASTPCRAPIGVARHLIMEWVAVTINVRVRVRNKVRVRVRVRVRDKVRGRNKVRGKG